jgi:hypothetical protein
MSRKRSKQAPPLEPTQELPYHEVMSEAAMMTIFDSAIRHVSAACTTLSWVQKHCRKILVDNEKEKTIEKRLENLTVVIMNFKNFKNVHFQVSLSKARTLAALEVLNYRGKVGTNEIDGFEFNTQHDSIAMLRLQRSKATPLVPSTETLEERAQTAVEKEQQLIEEEAELLCSQLTNTERVAAVQRAALKVYSEFIHARIAKQQCRTPDALVKDLEAMARVHQYYLTHGPHAQAPSKPEHGLTDGLEGLPEIPAPPHHYSLY